MGAFVLAHGCQPKGADGFAAAWATRWDVPQQRFPPDRWTAAELFARNTRIAEASDAVIAFWDGRSRGTLDTMRKAARLGKPVYDVLAKRQRRAPWSPPPLQTDLQTNCGNEGNETPPEAVGERPKPEHWGARRWWCD